jgi:hypothetical protein
MLEKLYSEADILAMRVSEEARLPGKNRQHKHNPFKEFE